MSVIAVSCTLRVLSVDFDGEAETEPLSRLWPDGRRSMISVRPEQRGDEQGSQNDSEAHQRR